LAEGPQPTGADEDPGWRRAVFSQLFPIGSRKGARTLDGLTVARVLFVALLQAAFAGGLILVIITRHIGHPTVVPVVLIVGLALGGIGAANRQRETELTATRLDELGTQYRTRFFKAFIANEIPLLVALVTAMVRQELWPYLIEVPFFIAGMTMIAPSRKNIARDQEQLAESGSRLSLRWALMAPPPPEDPRKKKKKT
jgi:hypothetical protein